MLSCQAPRIALKILSKIWPMENRIRMEDTHTTCTCHIQSSKSDQLNNNSMELKAYLFFFMELKAYLLMWYTKIRLHQTAMSGDADCWGWRHIGGPMVGCRLRVDLVRKDLMGPVTWANLFLRQCRWTPWAYLIRVTLSSEHWHRLFYNWDS